jgi:DNA-3-methyladenine glycosylase II
MNNSLPMNAKLGHSGSILHGTIMSYLYHLSVDKKLAPILGPEPLVLTIHTDVAARLMASIMSQQLSTRVAQVIHGRFLNLFNGSEPSAEQVLKVPYQTLRSIGLSHAKATYVHHVADFFQKNQVRFETFVSVPDHQVIEFLTQIKGVGRWTAEMFLMFTLAREDVFSSGDLGLQQAMIKLYKPRYTTQRELTQKLERIAQRWSPYRTYACMHLWMWKDEAG